jgi:hypothetical protein
METQIVPCRAEISDRFPVASFAVTVPPARCFEVACATDPRLFHTDWQRYRSPRNFYSSRSEGLMRAPGGHTAWFIPPEQLRRFAGSQRIYYALATYETAYGGAPQFSISPEGLEHVPFIGVAGDFTGRGLDRSRLGILPPTPDAYGAVDSAALTWGGDAALAAYRAADAAPGQGDEYDDGYPRDLWQDGVRAGEDPVAAQAGLGEGDWAQELSCGDVYGDDEHVAASGSALGDVGPADSGTYVPDEDPSASAYAYPHAAEGPADSGTYVPDEEPSATAYAYPHAAEGPADSGTYTYDDAANPDARHAHGASADAYGEDEPPISESYGAVHDDADDDGDDDDDAYGGSLDAAASDDCADDGDAYGGSADGVLDASAFADALGADDGDDEPPYEGGYGGGYAPPASAPVYGSVQGGGYDPAAEDSGGGVAVAEPEVGAEAQGTAWSVSGRDPGYSEEEPEDAPLPVGHAAQALAVVPLDIAEKVRILRVVARAESGADGYSAINPDNEYNDPRHPAYHRYHIGLSWGFIQFTQRSGSLGRVLQAVRRREDALGAALPAEHRFAALFGPHWQALLDVTTARDAEARVADVGGKPLWDPEWTARFRAAGRVPHVTWAQNEIAVTDYVDPTLRLARWLGFDTARALAMLWDRCIHMGSGGGTAWILRACGPVRTDEERRNALAALGHADLRAFQQSQAPHLDADGRWGPRTHAAMTAALRAIGARSPVAVPGRDALLQRMVDASAGTGFQRRLSALHANRADFDDATTYTLV